jgi:hypothetical protein
MSRLRGCSLMILLSRAYLFGSRDPCPAACRVAAGAADTHHLAELSSG